MFYKRCLKFILRKNASVWSIGFPPFIKLKGLWLNGILYLINLWFFAVISIETLGVTASFFLNVDASTLVVALQYTSNSVVICTASISYFHWLLIVNEVLVNDIDPLAQ